MSLPLSDILAHPIVARAFERIRSDPVNAAFVVEMNKKLTNPLVIHDANVKKIMETLTQLVNLPPIDKIDDYPIYYAPELCVFYNEQKQTERNNIINQRARELAMAITNATGL